MAYGIIRVREIGRAEVGATQLHNSREYDEKGYKTPENIDKSRKIYNREEFRTGESLTEAIDNRLKEAGVKERKNSVVAIEFVVSASKEFWPYYSETAFFANCHQFLENKYGAENVVAKNEHYDESNPHAHFIVTPIVEKETKWKNEKGEGVKKGLQLSARDLTGSKKHLIALQDDFFKHLDQKYNWRPIPDNAKFVRGKSAIEQNKNYTKHTSVELGVLKNDVNILKESIDEIKKNALGGLISFEEAIEKTNAIVKKIEIKEKEIPLLETKIEKAEKTVLKIEKRQDFNKNDKWKKGKDFKLGFQCRDILVRENFIANDYNELSIRSREEEPKLTRKENIKKDTLTPKQFEQKFPKKEKGMSR